MADKEVKTETWTDAKGRPNTRRVGYEASAVATADKQEESRNKLAAFAAAKRKKDEAAAQGKSREEESETPAHEAAETPKQEAAEHVKPVSKGDVLAALKRRQEAKKRGY